MKLTSLLPLFAIVLAFAACMKVDEFSEAEVISDNAEFAIPLIRANTTIQDLLENFDDLTYIDITAGGPMSEQIPLGNSIRSVVKSSGEPNP